MNDETEFIGINDKTEVRTKVYHLPPGGRIHEHQDMRERQEIKTQRRKQAWIRALIVFNVIMWTITAIYYAWKWEDIFR